MKKIALTLVAIAFGSCDGFAQSGPSAGAVAKEYSVQKLTFDKMSNPLGEEEEDQHIVGINALPELVLEHLKYSDLSAHTIVSVTEIEHSVGENDVTMHYVLLLQESPTLAPSEPAIVVRFDEFGKIISKKELPLLAHED